HPALFLHHVEHRDSVARQGDVVRAGETGRTRADDRDALAGRGQLRKWRRRPLHLHDHLARVPVALADRDLLLDETAAADLLARARTHQTECVWERQDFLHQARGLDVLPLRHELEVARDVDVRRAADLARRHAVRVVVAEDVLEVLPAHLEESVLGRGDLHARLDREVARRHRSLVALDVHQTHTARGCGCELLVVTERRDVEAGALRRAKDRLALDGRDLLAVDPDRARGLARRDIALMRHRRDLRLRGLRVPLEKAHAFSPLLNRSLSLARWTRSSQVNCSSLVLVLITAVPSSRSAARAPACTSRSGSGD